MKGDTVLDLVVFQLTAPRTRCELFVSADGMTEKLASGFLKPFLNHLRAVEEQVIAGCESVKLECPQTYHGRSWFTKGTLERFVRFVSTPEVLERVKFIEDELAQLEQVRGIQASSLLQVEDSYSTAEPIYQRNDGKSYSGPLGTFGITKLAQSYSYDAIDSRREASKVELLRAMDVRLLALRQEQGTVFSRASAAGFSSNNMMDLIAFSEYFGADRLRMACFNFLMVLQRRVMGPTNVNPQAVSSSYASEVDMLPKQEVWPESSFKFTEGDEADFPNGGHQINEARRYMINNGVVSISGNNAGFDGIQCRGVGGSDSQKILGQPDNICPDLFADQNRSDSPLPMLSGNSVMHCQDVHSTCGNTETGFVSNAKANIQEATMWQTHPLVDPIQGQDLLLQDTTVLKLDQSLDPHKESKALSTSEPNSLGKIPLSGGSTFESERSTHGQGLSPALVQPNNQRSSSIKPLGGSLAEQTNVNLSTVPSPVSAPARRLSVQDAISLFENKQRRESVEAPRKQGIGKHDSTRTSLEVTNALASACLGPRRWSTVNSNAGCKFLQENLLSSKQDTLMVSSETVRKGLNVLSPKQEQDGVGLQSKAFLRKGSNSALCQPSPNEISVKASNVERQVSGDSTLEYEVQGPVQFKRERSITRGEQGLLKMEANLAMQLTSFSDTKSNGSSLTKSSDSFEVGDEVPEKAGIYNSWEPTVMQDGAIIFAPSKRCDADLEVCDREHGVGVSKQHTKDASAMVFVVPEMATAQRSNRESSERIRADSLQYGGKNYAQMHGNQTQDDSDNLGRQKGRFYEQYRKLRDAKLKEEDEFKKSEREAKLRLMEETLLLRKTELDAQTMKLSMRNQQQVRAIKLQARKNDLQILERAQGDAIDEIYKETSSYSKGRARSPPFTSSSGKEENSTSKPRSGRKPSSVSQKGATPPRSSMRGTSLSPKLTPRSATGSTMKSRKSVVSGVSDNPLAKSVPSYANLRKENTKALAGCPSGNNCSQTKDGSCGCFCALTEDQSLEANGNILICTPPSVHGTSKDDKGLPLGWRSHSDLRIIPGSSGEDASAPPVFERIVGSEPGELSASKCDSSSLRQEIEQTAKEGEDSELPNVLEMETITTATALTKESAEADVSFGTNQITSLSFDVGTLAQFVAGGLSGGDQEDSYFHPQSERTLQSMYVADTSTSFRAISLPHEHHLPAFSHDPVSPPDSQLEQGQIDTASGNFSCSMAAGFESPLLSPAYWNATQIQQAPGSQKPATAVSNKELAKGLKKLLKFGRKNRASDAAMSDWASTCTTLEGDDELEDQKYSTDTHNAKRRPDESRAINIKGELHIIADKTSGAQSLRSSIPTPPANFKLRDDHLMGGTMLKAPKSFFSLSSFRSRGTEGRV